MPRMKSFKIILSSVLAVILLAASVVARIELTKATDKNAELNVKLNELRKENARLQIEYESSINLPELEDYAKNVLGMQKPESERIIEIYVDTSDKAIILKDGEKTEATKAVSSIMEYLSEVKCKFN